MLIQSFHRGGMHCDVSQTLNSIRAKFWIPQNRSAVKKRLEKCSVCTKAEGGPYRMPDTGFGISTIFQHGSWLLRTSTV